MAEDLKKSTISGIIWSAIEKFGMKIISFVTNIILARLLTPDDYGCVGMLMIFVLLSMTIVEGGFASALVQRKNSTKEDESTMFYWNILLSFLLYGILYFSAPGIAHFYNIPRLEYVLQVQGLMLLVNAFGIVPLAILQKKLLFKKLALIRTISAFLSVAVSLYMAFSGCGIWALVWQQTSMYFFITVFAWLLCRWYPTLQFSFASLKSMFSYGGFLLLSNLMNTLCDNVQGLIIGKRYSASDMGYYSQAKKLEEVPTTSIAQIVAQVTFPVFAKIQDDKQKLFAAVRKSLLAMNFVNTPLMLLLIIIAKPLISVLFSDKWIDSVPYFQILCLAGLANCGQSVNYQVVAAAGRSKEIFYWNFFKRLVGILCILIGMFWGIYGILWGMVASMYITYIVNAIVAEKTTGYSLWQQLKDFAPTLLIALISCAAGYIPVILSTSPLLEAIIVSTIYLVTYLLLTFALNKNITKLFITKQ